MQSAAPLWVISREGDRLSSLAPLTAQRLVTTTNNQERGYRMTGTVVAEALADMSAEKSRATEWHP